MHRQVRLGEASRKGEFPFAREDMLTANVLKYFNGLPSLSEDANYALLDFSQLMVSRL